ncbi:MAG: hypothetical protein IT559_06915 [Alphaproteobacteria bacterium]|nr:hypothetical protein [Alphaproteobacteria bacterium]
MTENQSDKRLGQGRLDFTGANSLKRIHKGVSYVCRAHISGDATKGTRPFYDESGEPGVKVINPDGKDVFYPRGKAVTGADLGLQPESLELNEYFIFQPEELAP